MWGKNNFDKYYPIIYNSFLMSAENLILGEFVSTLPREEGIKRLDNTYLPVQRELKAIKDTPKVVVSEAGRAAALFLPLTLTACNTSPSERINFSLDVPTISGIVSGIGLAVEEIIENNPNKNFGRKIIGVAFKGAAGYCTGHAIAHNVQEGNSWLSSNNVSETIQLVTSSYVITRESSLNQLKNGFSKVFSGLRSDFNKATEGSKARREEYINRKIEEALKERTSINKAAGKLLKYVDKARAAKLLIQNGWPEKNVNNLLNIK
jgi:hypothetical protein